MRVENKRKTNNLHFGCLPICPCFLLSNNRLIIACFRSLKSISSLNLLFNTSHSVKFESKVSISDFFNLLFDISFSSRSDVFTFEYRLFDTWFQIWTKSFILTVFFFHDGHFYFTKTTRWRLVMLLDTKSFC